jgi:hypothetical protein
VSRDSVFGISTKVRTGRPGFRILASYLCILRNVETISPIHLVPYSMGAGLISRGVKQQGRHLKHLPPPRAEVKDD